MPLPEFNRSGDLPDGVHVATLSEVLQRFGRSNRARQIMAKRLQSIFDVAQSTGCVERFLVYGSFVTNKLEPNDVDVFLVMNDNFAAGNF
ncbi:MAG TPA: hypothetical protein VK137_13015, partial [Planctomycetaceae bacterium]|nr:hypothetical protein [Planctomycetaceae bacterium]